MKKLICISLALAALCLMTSCASTPGAAAKSYMEALGNGSYDKFIDGIAFDEGTSAEEVEKSKAELKALLEAKGKPEIEKKGGLKSVEIISEEIAEDGQTARVEYKQTYGDGTTEDGKAEMVLVDGKWKMEMKK